jgi:hypothetical protein
MTIKIPSKLPSRDQLVFYNFAIQGERGDCQGVGRESQMCNFYVTCPGNSIIRLTERHSDRWKTERQKDRQTDRQTDGKTDRPIYPPTIDAHGLKIQWRGYLMFFLPKSLWGSRFSGKIPWGGSPNFGFYCIFLLIQYNLLKS